jgi:hypothetical protein
VLFPIYIITFTYISIYTYTTTTTVVRDLSSCSVCKFLVMVALQVFGAGCCLLFIFIRHYECADPLVFHLSVCLSVCIFYR